MTTTRTSPELVALGWDERDDELVTSREMIARETRLERSGNRLAEGRHHHVGAAHVYWVLDSASAKGLTLSGEQRGALERITERDGLASVIGYAGTGKSAMLGVAQEAWESDGYTARGAVLSWFAAENLEAGSGIQARTIASLEYAWEREREQLSPKGVLVVDGAVIIGTRQMERLLPAATRAGAKVVLVGDPEQLQAIEAGAASRALSERHGAAEITEIRWQRTDWQRDVTRWRHGAHGRGDRRLPRSWNGA